MAGSEGWFFRILRFLLYFAIGLVKVAGVGFCCLKAYRLRVMPVKQYGYIIHEFDPWFNYRAAEYLNERGVYDFFHWYDHMSWYPLGRPIGTTIYPGMQLAAVGIYRVSQALTETTLKTPKGVRLYLSKHLPIKDPMSYLPGHGTLWFGPMTLNEVCCLLPAWFGALATFLVALLTAEVSGSTGAAVVAAAVMCVIPAHMLRSMGGGFDNECVAFSAFCLTFWLWCRCLRHRTSWPYAFPAGLAYAFAASTWGGYIFVNNLVALHAAVIVVMGKYTTGTYRSYTIFYVVGTAGAMCVPVIGWTPLKSMEQMPSTLTFCIYQLLEFCDVIRRSRKNGMGTVQFAFFRIAVFLFVGLAAAGAAYVGMQQGFFAPWTSRIRALFLKHRKTGNPLVDSVAEHTAGNSQTYSRQLGPPRFLACVGLLFCWHQKSPSKFFPVIYAATAYHFSLKMMRLIVICGPIVSILAGYPVGIVGDWCLDQLVNFFCGVAPAPAEEPQAPATVGSMAWLWGSIWSCLQAFVYPAEVRDFFRLRAWLRRHVILVDRVVGVAFVAVVAAVAWNYREPVIKEVTQYKFMGDIYAMSINPRLVYDNERTGQRITDYLDAYLWLKGHTPEDARILSWWDYGYQITGVANRTTLADGNTWNHEHIATLGRILSNPEKKAWNIMRHLADYVLVWQDDLGKSTHFVRIGNSVFPDICGAKDPMCNAFTLYRERDGSLSPSKMMAESFIYRAVKHDEGEQLERRHFRMVYRSKNSLVKIFKILNIEQESKRWIADPKNRICDAPGSWYCVGQYPPLLAPLIAMRKNFAQLEDFNKNGTKSDYTKAVEAAQKAS